jgi:hypothetical protein
MNTTATVGAVEHGNAMELVTLVGPARLLDRRRIDLTTGLPTQPYHHEGAWAVGRYLESPWARPTTLPEALDLIATVTAAAAVGARDSLARLASSLPVPIGTIAIRSCPPLPESVEARVRDNRVQVIADSVMYRLALANAAAERGCTVVWYDRDRVHADAARRVGEPDIDAVLKAMGRSVGPPWQARHRLAAAAAIAAAPTEG